MAISIFPRPKTRFFDDDGSPLNGGKVYFYVPGTATLKDTYTDEGGGTANSNPVILDSNGRAEIWLNGFYDVQLDRSDDTTVWTVDNISSGSASTATAISEWISPGHTPTFISTTQFSVTGDQTTIYQVGRRVKCTVTTGTVYGRVSGSAYTTLTTVTVVLDSGTLDSGLSVVDVGILSRSNSSIPTIPDATVAEHAATAQQIQSGELIYAADTGAADVYVMTLAPAITALTTGMKLLTKIANANLTTTPTLNPNAIGAKTIKQIGGAALNIGDLPANHWAEFVYDGTDMILQNPAQPSPSFSVHRNSVDQSNITGVDKIEWTTADFDTNSDFDIVTNFRFTPTVAGKYLLTAQVRWENITATDEIQLLIRKNGTTVLGTLYKSVGAASEYQSVTVVVDANGSTDYFEVFCTNGGRDTSDIAGESNVTSFTGSKIG